MFCVFTPNLTLFIFYIVSFQLILILFLNCLKPLFHVFVNVSVFVYTNVVGEI